MTASCLFAALWLFMLLFSIQAKIEISEDTMWTTNQNLTEQVLIKPGITLRIRGNAPQEPVIIDLKAESADVGGFLVSSGAKLEIENAVLTRSNQDVDFTAISYVDESHAVVILTHVRCEKQSTCLVRFCCDGNEVFVQDSVFYKNKVALAGNGRMDDVRRTLFVDNVLAITNADWNIEDCVFLRNEQASNAANIRFTRTIFIENVQGVSDPGGEPSPFLHDVLFYRNQKAVLPSLTDKGHAAMERVSFVENQSPIYCKSGLPPLIEVNFINSTEYDLIYAGTSAAQVSPQIYWGKHESASTLRRQIYDGLSGSKGGIVVVNEFSHEPFKHEMILFLLEHNPTPLISEMTNYFGDWKTDHHVEEHTSFDFGLLREWTQNDGDDIIMETKAEMEKEPVVEVKDSETNGVVEVPEDVVAVQETAPPVPEGNTNLPNKESKQMAQESYDDHETTKHDEHGEPLDVSAASAAKLIHSYDERGTILLVSLVLNTCLLWILSLLGFDYFCRQQSSPRYSRLSTEEKKEELDENENDDDAAFEAKRPGKVHVV